MKNAFMGVSASNCLQRLFCGASLLVLTVCLSTNVFAEKAKKDPNALKKGDIIMGNVSDNSNLPMEEVKVLEATAEDRVMAFGTTDANGDFSFKVYNPKDSIKIRHKGYKEIVLPMDKKYYSIILTPAPADPDYNK